MFLLNSVINIDGRLNNTIQKIKMRRNRITYLGLIIITILVGLVSRTNLTPKSIYTYGGDFFDAFMVFFIISYTLRGGTGFILERMYRPPQMKKRC